jgi:hypothetical protein
LSKAAGSIGAVAFSRTGDPLIGEFGDARLLKKFGNVPDDLSGAVSPGNRQSAACLPKDSLDAVGMA